MLLSAKHKAPQVRGFVFGGWSSLMRIRIRPLFSVFPAKED